jgi:predicted RNase H-like HicB family nuclease
MASHDEILEAVRRIAASRADWSFTPDEIVRALPHLNPGTVRTHVTSRCCINAPKNHPHKWDYFERVARGRYRLVRGYRPAKRTTASMSREARSTYGRTPGAAPRHAVHAVVSRSGRWYTSECLELAIVTQGRTLDETVANLKAAINLHLEGEDAAAFGVALPVTLHVVYEDDVA